MTSKLLLSASFALVVVCSAGAGDEPYRAAKGDTLWDLAGKHWKDPKVWPELWSLNPQIRNPHRIYPGDPIYFDRSGLRVTLPLERLPSEASAPTPAAASASPPVPARAAMPPGFPSSPVHLANRQGQDFVSSHRTARLGTVRNFRQVKNAYGAGEDIEVDLTADSNLKPGDLATLFDDSVAVTHPETKQPQGYYTRILGHLRVTSISGGQAVARLLETYDAVEDGAGVMPYRKPVSWVDVKAAKIGVEGVLLHANPERTLFASEDVVFLDKGAIHGVEPGVLLDVPVPDEPQSAQGMVDLVKPLARIVVVSAEDKTATGLIVQSRAAVASGSRFVVTPQP